MTVAEFNQRVAIGAQVAIIHCCGNSFARIETTATQLLGLVTVREIDGRFQSAVVGMIAPLWFGEECDD